MYFTCFLDIKENFFFAINFNTLYLENSLITYHCLFHMPYKLEYVFCNILYMTLVSFSVDKLTISELLRVVVDKICKLTYSFIN